MSGRGRFLLVLGGQRSGKSAYAAQRVAAADAAVVVVAPAVVRDEEFADRVARHRADRPTQWRTLEHFDLAAAVREAGPHAAVLIDAVDTWLAEVLLQGGVDLGDEGPTRATLAAAETDIANRLDALLRAVRSRSGLTVVVAGQPGLGVHAAGRGSRAYVDVHGRAVQRLSRGADEAVLLVGGRPVALGAAIADDARGAGPTPVSRDHGDTQVPTGAVDLAVNVLAGPPGWLAADLAAASRDLAQYPDDTAARHAAAARHGRVPAECVVVPGAAEAFWALPRALRPSLAACVHPSFTEPEAALQAAGVPVVRVNRSPADGWALDPATVPEAADLVVVGRPDNPTGMVDDAASVAALCRPGRTVVVDEAFAEFLPEAGGLADRHDLPGLVSVRSLTKLWGLAGLRVGYLVGPAELVARLDADRQPWATSTPSLLAVERLVAAEDERRARAARVADNRAALLAVLRAVDGVTAWDGGANFLLLRTGHPDLRTALLRHGFAVRRGDTFPGLDRSYVRVAVREPDIGHGLAAAIRTVLEANRGQ